MKNFEKPLISRKGNAEGHF